MVIYFIAAFIIYIICLGVIIFTEEDMEAGDLIFANIFCASIGLVWILMLPLCLLFLIGVCITKGIYKVKEQLCK